MNVIFEMRRNEEGLCEQWNMLNKPIFSFRESQKEKRRRERDRNVI